MMIVNLEAQMKLVRQLYWQQTLKQMGIFHASAAGDTLDDQTKGEFLNGSQIGEKLVVGCRVSVIHNLWWECIHFWKS